jgi:hypothetical protein
VKKIGVAKSQNRSGLHPISLQIAFFSSVFASPLRTPQKPENNPTGKSLTMIVGTPILRASTASRSPLMAPLLSRVSVIRREGITPLRIMSRTVQGRDKILSRRGSPVTRRGMTISLQ